MFEQLSDPQSPTTPYLAMDGTLYSGGYQYPAPKHRQWLDVGAGQQGAQLQLVHGHLR